MFERGISANEILEKVRPSEHSHHFTDTLRGEVNALSNVARKHPAASGSTLAAVSLVAFGLGFLAGHLESDARKPVKTFFKKRRRRFGRGARRGPFA
ncbi:hypothetical protein [Martelella mediterranea]|uniref:Uncharacterized protein n=1 Tax=Martelella mediterranea TaxID=293089 RepID=A0A4R3NQR6_9HYPH|nr:hypothetical protein [Martelella mediterranea]TCT37614.1 hypothetical protein EDC90_10173 [Martelella mediterranea]